MHRPDLVLVLYSNNIESNIKNKYKTKRIKQPVLNMPKNAFHKKRKLSSVVIGREYKKQAIENWKTHTEQDLRDIACIQRATAARINEKEKAVHDTYAIKMQAVIRGWLIRMRFKPFRTICTRVKRATIKIQALARGYFVRKRWCVICNGIGCFSKENGNAFSCLCNYTDSELVNYAEFMNGEISPLYDMTFSQAERWDDYLEKFRAAIKIQALVRGYFVRKRKKPHLRIEIPKWNIEEDTLEDGTIVRHSGPGHMGSPVMEFNPPEFPNNFRDQTIREFTSKRDCILKGTFVPKGTLIRRVCSPVSGSPHFEVIPHPLKGIVPDPTEWHQETVTNTLAFKTWVRPGKHASDHINIWDNGTITMSLSNNCFIG